MPKLNWNGLWGAQWVHSGCSMNAMNFNSQKLQSWPKNNLESKRNLTTKRSSTFSLELKVLGGGRSVYNVWPWSQLEQGLGHLRNPWSNDVLTAHDNHKHPCFRRTIFPPFKLVPNLFNMTLAWDAPQLWRLVQMYKKVRLICENHGAWGLQKLNVPRGCLTFWPVSWCELCCCSINAVCITSFCRLRQI